MAAANEETTAESILQDAEKRATEAFEIFDLESNKTIDIREVGTVIRSLGLCPSEEELQDILAELEGEEPSDYIKFDRYLPVVTKILLERRYRLVPESHVLKAFETLDADGKGYLTEEELTTIMTTDAEPFSPEELEEMIQAAVDPEKKLVLYKEFAPLLTVDQVEPGPAK